MKIDRTQLKNRSNAATRLSVDELLFVDGACARLTWVFQTAEGRFKGITMAGIATAPQERAVVLDRDGHEVGLLDPVDRALRLGESTSKERSDVSTAALVRTFELMLQGRSIAFPFADRRLAKEDELANKKVYHVASNEYIGSMSPDFRWINHDGERIYPICVLDRTEEDLSKTSETRYGTMVITQDNQLVGPIVALTGDYRGYIVAPIRPIVRELDLHLPCTVAGDDKVIHIKSEKAVPSLAARTEQELSQEDLGKRYSPEVYQLITGS